MPYDKPGPSHAKLSELSKLTKPHGLLVTLPGTATPSVDESGNVSFAESPDRFRIVADSVTEPTPYLDPDSGSELFDEERIRKLFGP